MMKKNVLVLLSFVVLVILSTNVLGAGISPSFLYMDDLARGNTYEKNFRALNLEDYAQKVELSISGDAAEWATITDEIGNEIASLDIPPKSNVLFSVSFEVPGDAPNAVYEGHINVDSLAADVENPVNVVTRNIYRLTVTGDERIDGYVDSISTSDTESGQPLIVVYGFKNTGNVGATPIGKAKIYQDGELVDSVEDEGEYAKMGEFKNQELVWDTSNRGTGDFTIDVQIYLDGKRIGGEELEFNLAPLGTYTAQASVGDVNKEDTWVVDTVGKVEIKVFNTGKIAADAKVVTEVVKDGKVIDVIQGDALKIDAGSSEELYYYYKPEDAGDLVFKSKILFGGKEFDVDDSSVSVLTADEAAANADSFDSGSSPLVAILIGIGVVLIVGVLVYSFIFRKK